VAAAKVDVTAASVDTIGRVWHNDWRIPRA